MPFVDLIRRIFGRKPERIVPQVEITPEMIDAANRFLNDEKQARADHMPTEPIRHSLGTKEDETFREMLEKYGDAEIARMIAAGSVWVGMTKVQLTESVGFPDTLDEKVTRTKSGAKRRLVYKYGRTGMRSFSKRVFLEDDLVTGWQISN